MRQPDAALLLRPDHKEERDELLGRRAAAEAKKRRDFELYQADVLTDLELAAARKKSRDDLAEVAGRLAGLEAADALARFIADPGAAWEDAPLDQRQAVVSALMFVTVLPAGPPPGVRPGVSLFDPDGVDVRWARRLPSDA